MTDATPLASEQITQEDRECLPPDAYDIGMLKDGGMPGCPCCGKTAVTFSRFFPHSSIYQAYVHCAHCDMQVFKNARDHDEARQLAKDAWSKRPTRGCGAQVERDPAIACLASLRAAVSLLEKGGKKAAASDKIFAQMLVDYKRAADNFAAALSATPAPSDQDASQAQGEVRRIAEMARDLIPSYEDRGIGYSMTLEVLRFVAALSPAPGATAQDGVGRLREVIYRYQCDAGLAPDDAAADADGIVEAYFAAQGKVEPDEYMSVTIDRDGNVTSHNAYDANFDEMVDATRKIIAALQERLDRRMKCPFAAGKELRAMPTIPAGMVAVPRVATPEMVEAGQRAMLYRHVRPQAVWTAMQNAAPKQAEQQGDFVAGPSWEDADGDGDGGTLWTAEIQTVGGYCVVATVHGADHAQVTQRQASILAALNAPTGAVEKERG